MMMMSDKTRKAVTMTVAIIALAGMVGTLVVSMLGQ